MPTFSDTRHKAKMEMIQTSDLLVRLARTMIVENQVILVSTMLSKGEEGEVDQTK